MKTSAKYHNPQGFTLLELIIAMTILGLMMAVIMGGFHLGIRAWEKGEAKAEHNQKLRVVLDNMLEEIRSAHSLFIQSDEKVKYHAFWGENDRIKFITTASGLQGEANISYTRAVTYYVSSGTGLVMKETACLGGDCFEDLESRDEVVLDPNVSSIQFQYCYIPEPKKGEEKATQSQAECVSVWDPTEKESINFEKQEAAPAEEEPAGPPVQKLPNWVEVTISLEFEDENKSRELPTLKIPIYLGKETAAPKE
ncbi:MAG: type II secretion system protein [Candidatus Schekmanbacteria bacterium]|nr:type II secretion system protein [Candidatus Schekmanbacteria bacterium]